MNKLESEIKLACNLKAAEMLGLVVDMEAKAQEKNDIVVNYPDAFMSRTFNIFTNPADTLAVVKHLTINHSIVVTYWKKQDKFRWRRVLGDPSQLFDTYEEAVGAAVEAISE